MLEGLKNFLQLINDNWGVLIAIASLLFALYKKTKKFVELSKEEKAALAEKTKEDLVNAAIEQIRQRILKLVADAEAEHANESGVGMIKRAQVLTEVYDKYPILSQVVSQEQITKTLDALIDNSLKEMKELAENSETFKKKITTAVDAIAQPIIIKADTVVTTDAATVLEATK